MQYLSEATVQLIYTTDIAEARVAIFMFTLQLDEFGAAQSVF